MTEEIKEILEDMKIVAEHKTVGVMGQRLNFKNARLLLDYITNLQEQIKKYDKELTHKTQQYEYIRHHDFSKEIDKLTAESTEWESKYYDMEDNFHNAYEENKKLKEQINEIKKLDRMRFNMLISHYGILQGSDENV